MLKFSVKSAYFTTPIKLILPGIIVAIAGYFLFNNPAKKKARDTFQNWNVIKEYEAAFIKGTEDAICGNDTLDQFKFRKDYSHLLEILINNLTDLKKDNNVDKRLDAFLNIKIARYSEAKKMTEDYLDTILVLNKAAMARPRDTSIQKVATQKLQVYMNELAHVEGRDTAELSRIATELNKQHLRYTDSFTVNNNPLQPLNEMTKNYIGNWWFREMLVMIEFKADQTGIWEGNGVKLNFKWTRDNYKLTLEFEGETDHIFVLKANENSISIYWKERNLPTVGCRRSKPSVPDLLKQKK